MGCPERCLGLLEISWKSIPNVGDAEDAEELGMIGNDRNRQWLLDFLENSSSCQAQDVQAEGPTKVWHPHCEFVEGLLATNH